jgi:hypothetical protein
MANSKTKAADNSTSTHSSPASFARPDLISAAIVFVASLLLYRFTLAPTVTLVDSGELIAAAHTLGVAHPPGFPLYVLLAHLSTLVPIGNVAQRVNFASAIFGAASAAVVALAVTEAIAAACIVSANQRRVTKRSGRKKGAEVHPIKTVPWAGALLAGLLLAVSRTLWSYATIAEVYTLNTLLILVIFWLMLRWRRMQLETRQDGSSEKHLLVAALVFGLALGVHHVSVGLTLPALAALVYSTRGVTFFKSKQLLRAGLLALVGLSVYLYLPVAASRSPIMNWGDPDSLQRLWWHVSGRQYQVFFSLSIERMLDQFSQFIVLLGHEFGPWWLPLGLVLVMVGMVAAFKRERTLFWFLALVMLINLPYALNYEIAEDKDAYYLPTFAAMVIAAGVGMHWLFEVIRLDRLKQATRTVALVVLTVLTALIALAANLPYNNRSSYFIARDYVDNVLAAVEPDGMVLTIDWQVYSPMLYALEIEKHRRDVVAIDLNQLRRSWYFDYLNQAYPALMDQTRNESDAFLEDLRQWEQDPDLFERDAKRIERINTRFREMILALVRKHIKTGPVYMTQELVTGVDPQYRELTAALEQEFQYVPQGLVFQLRSGRGFVEPMSIELETRGLADGSIKFLEGDVVRVKVLPAYVAMLVNRGRYLAAHGRHAQAIEAFEAASRLDSRSTAAQRGKTESEAALRKK